MSATARQPVTLIWERRAPRRSIKNRAQVGTIMNLKKGIRMAQASDKEPIMELLSGSEATPLKNIRALQPFTGLLAHVGKY